MFAGLGFSPFVIPLFSEVSHRSRWIGLGSSKNFILNNKFFTTLSLNNLKIFTKRLMKTNYISKLACEVSRKLNSVGKIFHYIGRGLEFEL
jgi:hypothetical protein